MSSTYPKFRALSGRRAKRLRFMLALLAGLLALMVAASRADNASALTTSTNCALPGSSFQGGDGNQATPTLGEQAFCTEHLLPTTRDWQNLANPINSPDPQAQDNMFSGGNKESVPGKWVLENAAGGVTPGKANILSAWSQADPQAADTFLYLGFERESTTGDTFLTFELNQVKGLWENEKNAKIPCRTSGDVLISYNVGGSSSVEVVIYRWVTDKSTSTIIPPDPTAHPCATEGHFEPSGGTPVAPPFEQGEMNFGEEITNFLTDTANPPTPTKFAAGSFGEASLNLTAIFENANLGPCFSFGQMWMSSRSSESIESQLQDYVGPVNIQANSCSISGRKFDDANGSGVDEASKPGLGGWTIQLLDSTGTKVLQTTTTASDGTYTFTNVPPGSYVLREVSKSGWTCDYPGTGSACQHTVTLDSDNVNSTGNDFGNRPSSTVTTKQNPESGVVGSAFGDSATVAGPTGAPTPTGTVEFTLYSDNHCGTAVAGPISEPLVAGSASIPDASKVKPPAGTFWWVAKYSGDSGNASGSSGCADEPITVGQATPSIETTQQPASDVVGATFKDKATIAGLFGAKPAGSVSWKLYSNSKCEGEPVAADGPVAVSGNGEYTTPTGASPNASGTYYWVASYDGDANNKAVSSGCADEPITVGQASPSIVTTQQPASDVVGATFKDKASIAGLFGVKPGGSVSWKLYANGKCEGSPVATDGPVTVSGDGEYTTPTGASPNASGTYYWVASYSGDANNKAVSSGCADEPITVGQASPSIVTTQQPASDVVGATFKDKASIAGLFGVKPGGSVSWKLYANSKCEGSPVATDGPVTVSGDGEYTTPAGASPNASGTYYWLASYSGDANNKAVSSGCADEPITVGQASPSIVTTQQPASDVVGATFKDKASIAGLFGVKPGGSVSWKLYANSKCEGSPVATDGPVTVSGNGEYTTPSGASPDEAGTYYWVASYSGDANNKAVSSGCADEPITVGHATPSIVTTQQPASGVVGSTFKDKATLAGLFGVKPAGSVSWKLYANGKCEGSPVATDGPVTVSGNGDYTTSAGASPSEAGTYYWVASYSGDANNKAVSSACADEPITVGQASPSIETTQQPASDVVGSTFKDRATLAGLFGVKPGGSVSWKLFANSKCEGSPVATDGPAAVSGNGDYTTPAGASPTEAGTYYWVASYSGDTNNKAVSSGCADEPITVGPATPSIETTQQPASGVVGSTFKDKASIAGLFGVKPGGSVSWKLYANSKCEASPVATDGPVTVSGNGEYSTPSGASPDEAGTYYWVASYSGDTNNKAVSSGCADEPITVGQATPSIETTQQPSSDVVGATFKDKASIAGLFGVKPGGSVSWKLYANGKCEGSPVATDGPVTVSGNGDYTTPSGAAPSEASTYYWVASYSGDLNNKAVSSGCADEPITVGQATPSIETTQQPASDVVGATFKDKASIAGLFGVKPGGSVSWKLYDNSKCEGSPVATDGPVAVGGDGDYTTPAGASPDEAGTYYWVASYSGDTNNKAVSSGCADEPIVVGHASPSIETTQQPASDVVGSTFKDKATIAGLFGVKPAGSVSWKLYDNSKCEGEPGATDGPVAVSANGDYTTPSGASPTEAGTYYWVASYSGDANNKAVSSGCADEPITIGQATPSIETTQQPASDVVGSTFKDKATIAGLFGVKPGGSVSWKLYDNSKCEGEALAADGPVAVSGNGDYTTPAGASPTEAGTYYWVASYSGDVNNKAVSSGCADEPITVGQASPSIETTQQPASGVVGTTFRDEATIAALFGDHPGGSVSWKLYDNPKCEGEPVAADGPVAVSGNGDYTTPAGASLNDAGTYYWVASYSGDANNKGVSSGCADEPVRVAQASPSIETTQQPASGTVGATFNDEATIAGLLGTKPGGSVSWKLFANSKCEGDAVASDGPVTVSGNGKYTTPNGASPSEAGTYYWVATYTGDANNIGVSSGCADEPITVGQATPSILTTQRPASGTVGSVFKDEAAISGLYGAKPGGSVSWKLYANKACEGAPVATDGPVAVGGNGGYTTPNGASPTVPGTYYWVATYSGDTNNKAVSSGCADEPVTVAAVAVLPLKVISGVATPSGPAGCVAQATPVYVTGRQITTATFYVDGHKVKTVTKADKRGRYGITVNARKMRFGVHRVKVVVVFATGSETKPKTLRVVVIRCRPPAPKFTG